MNPGSLTVAADRLLGGLERWRWPLALVDLDDTQTLPEAPVLPACPVIGFGDPAHPLAGALDAVIEAPVSAAALARQVGAAPNAAAVTAQLLRLLPSLSPEAGLTAESLAYGLLPGAAEHRAWLAGRSGGHSVERALRVERSGDRLTVTLDDPGSGNAIDRAMRDALYEAFELAVLDTDLRISLRGAGRTFSLGAELAEFGTTTDPAAAHAIRMQTLPARMIARCADRLDVHVQGGCVGAGLEMAAWAARLTAASDAWFQLPELAMGLLPGAGGCVSLTRRIGRQRTALLILSGKRISARTALAWGLVDAIVDEPA
ncbi:MAG: enoyl-CoA hydratase/isomerase family protein [Novosphingobium sp.]